MAHTDVALVLKLGGIPYIFYGADGTYVAAAPAGYPVTPFTCVNCIDLTSVRPIREEMPKFGGIAKASTYTLTLRDRSDIGALFSRTLEGVTPRSNLNITLEAEAIQ